MIAWCSHVDLDETIGNPALICYSRWQIFRNGGYRSALLGYVAASRIKAQFEPDLVSKT
jgi:hypothetical protein